MATQPQHRPTEPTRSTEPSESSEPAERPLRRDALENRERILRAARELFAARGLDVTLNDIAHHAGVGVGTAYRRFANKGEVLDALFEEQVAELSEITDRALGYPDPWEGMVYYLEKSMALQASDKGLAQFLSGDRVPPEQFDWSRDILAPKVNAIVARAKDAGLLRADVEGTDLIFIQLGLNAIMSRSCQAHPRLYRRYLALFLDGLRTGPSRSDTALPAPALTTAETHRLMAARRRSRGTP